MVQVSPLPARTCTAGQQQAHHHSHPPTPCLLVLHSRSWEADTATVAPTRLPAGLPAQLTLPLDHLHPAYLLPACLPTCSAIPRKEGRPAAPPRCLEAPPQGRPPLGTCGCGGSGSSDGLAVVAAAAVKFWQWWRLRTQVAAAARCSADSVLLLPGAYVGSSLGQT